MPTGDIEIVSIRSVPAMICACVWLGVTFAGQGQAAELEELLEKGHVPGLSYAVIRDGKIADLGALGTRDTSTGALVDQNTVFEAASLSKPVFAFAVLRLVDSGVLSLDTPLADYAPNDVKGDPRAATVTVRDVLSQSSGLPNWGSWITPVKTYFPPGSQFSYSGEGFVWLQRVVVAATGERLEDVMDRLVFDPLQMKQTSYVWRADFEENHAIAHEGLKPREKARPTEPRLWLTRCTRQPLTMPVSCKPPFPAPTSSLPRQSSGFALRLSFSSAVLNAWTPTRPRAISMSLGVWAGGLSHNRGRFSIGETMAASKLLRPALRPAAPLLLS